MSLFVLLTGTGLFAFAMILHLLVWRYSTVRREMFWLFVLFFGFPFLPLAWLCGTAKTNGVETFAIALLWIALASAYAQTYPVLRHVIPSFRILLLLRKYGHAGLSEEEIVRFLAQEKLFASGLNDLENDSLITKVGDRYLVTRTGAFLAGAFRLYRRVLGVRSGLG